MSYKYGTSIVPGAYHYGAGGLGVPGASVPSTGANGPGYLYNDLSLPADNAVEVRGLIETFPVGLTSFTVFEDSSFTALGPDNTYSFTYRLYDDGVDRGTAISSFTIGDPGALSGNVTLADVSPSGSINSAPSVFTGNVTSDDAVPSGSLSSGGAVFLSGAVTLDDVDPSGYISSGVSILTGAVTLSDTSADGGFVGVPVVATGRVTFVTNAEILARYD